MRDKVPSYNYREAQESLALRVGQSFQNGVHSLVQAPTGTGKTLGYLLPSMIFAKDKKERVLVSTGTKALQEQAIAKDIPSAMSILDLAKSDFKVVRLVGSKNHLCELFFRKQNNEEEGSFNLDEYEEKLSKAYLELVFFYNSRLLDYNKSITNDGIPYVLKKNFQNLNDKLKDIQVEYKACIGGKCPFKDSCTYFQGLQLAKEAEMGANGPDG